MHSRVLPVCMSVVHCTCLTSSRVVGSPLNVKQVCGEFNVRGTTSAQSGFATASIHIKQITFNNCIFYGLLESVIETPTMQIRNCQALASFYLVVALKSLFQRSPVYGACAVTESQSPPILNWSSCSKLLIQLMLGTGSLVNKADVESFVLTHLCSANSTPVTPPTYTRAMCCDPYVAEACSQRQPELVGCPKAVAVGFQ